MNAIVPVKKPKFGRPTDYDEGFHIKLLYDSFINDEGIIGFCADANISVKTFHNWVRKHKKFKYAYEIFLPKGAKKSEKDAKLLGKDLNFQQWKFSHTNKYGRLYQKFPKLKNRNVGDKLDATWDSLEKGFLTPQEFNQVTAGLVSQLKIKELELKTKELELKQKELELQRKPQFDYSKLSDEKIQTCMDILSGKKVVVVEE